MDILAGKRALIVGVATERSIAWGIAQAMRAHGAELAFSYAETLRQCLYACAVAVKGAIGNKGQSAANGVGSSTPGGQIGSRLGPATQARAKACFLRRCRRTKKAAVRKFRGVSRTNRPAIDAGRCDAYK